MKITTMRGLDGARAALNKRSCPEPRSTAVGHGELSSPDSCPIVRHMSAYGPVRRAPCTPAHQNRGGGRGQPGPRWSSDRDPIEWAALPHHLQWTNCPTR